MEGGHSFTLLSICVVFLHIIGSKGATTTTESASTTDLQTEQNGSDKGKKSLSFFMFIINKTKNLNISTLTRLKFLV